MNLVEVDLDSFVDFDIATLKEKMSQLEQAAAYAQQYQNQQSYQGQPQQDSSNKDDDIIDADFTMKPSLGSFHISC